MTRLAHLRSQEVLSPSIKGSHQVLGRGVSEHSVRHKLSTIFCDRQHLVVRSVVKVPSLQQSAKGVWVYVLSADP